MERFYPKAELLLQSSNGGAYKGGPARGVLHTTETSNWAGQSYYHVAAKLENGVVRWQQYTAFDVAARGLRHPAGTPDTNRQGSACIQVALIGYAKDSPKLPGVVVDELGRFMRWCEVQFGIEPVAPDFLGSEAWGASSPARMSDSEWAGFNGWCGHQHVPHNTHWDPGKINIGKLLGVGAPVDDGGAVVAGDKFVSAWQAQLNDHGFPAGGVDGVVGKNTIGGVHGMLDAVVETENKAVLLEERIAVLEGRVNKLKEI